MWHARAKYAPDSVLPTGMAASGGQGYGEWRGPSKDAAMIDVLGFAPPFNLLP
jgi:hypothetical protein